MTANYFMVTRDGTGLDGALYRPFVRGTSAVATSVSDLRAASLTVRRNCFTDPKFELGAGGWALTNASWSSGGKCIVFAPTSTVPGKATITLTGLLFDCRLSIMTTAEFGGGATMKVYSAPGGFLLGETLLMGNSGFAQVAAVEFIPNYGSAYIEVTVPTGSGSNPTMDLTYCGPVGDRSYFDGTTANTDDGTTAVTHAWSGSVNASQSVETTATYDKPSTIEGVPADLEPFWMLHKGESDSVRPPSGFHKSVFRVARDPAVATDDSSNALAVQVYDHGWLLAYGLMPHLIETGELAWPLPSNLSVVPVTGTPAAADGNGWHGMTTVTWPGSGVGTIRQILSGSEGSTRKVAAILDLLAATTNGQRNTIASTYAGSVASFDTARNNLLTAVGGSLKFWARSLLAGWLGLAAVGQGVGGAALTNDELAIGVFWGMVAVTAQEAGLVGSTFTSGNYTTLTDPIDAVLAMPSGY